MRSFGVVVRAVALFVTVTTADFDLEPRTQCHSGVYTIVARGTSEPQGGSKLETIVGPLTSAIPGSASNEVVYPADNDFYNSVKMGVRNAQQQIQDYASACPDSKMVIFGYSQGAYVMSLSLAGGDVQGTTFDPISQDIGKNIVSVVMFGDSSRVLGQGTAAEGAGACKASSPLVRTGAAVTAMDFYADRLQDWCAAADPICCKTGNNIQAHLSYWSDQTTNTAVQFVENHASNAASASASSPSTTTSAASTTTSVISSSVPVAALVTPSSAAEFVSSALKSAAALTSSVTSEASLLTASSSSLTSSATISISTSASALAPSATPSTGAARTSSQASLLPALLLSCIGLVVAL
nr:putative cutinase [Quercus suber]